jgi:hypothetical protein
MIALLLEGDATEKAVFTIFFLPAFLLFIESFYRRVTLTAEGLAIRKFGRTKAFSWNEINRVDCLTVHRKVYLLMTTVEGVFVIVSSAFGGFSRLVDEVLAYVSPERVEEDVRPQAAKAGTGIMTLAPAWFAALFMMFMVAVKLYPFTAGLS